MTDDQQRKLTLVTDGRKPQKSKDANNQEVAAHWSGKQIATDEKGPHGKMSRTYELSYDGTQLYETLHMTMGRRDTTLLVRYVYDAYGPPLQPRRTPPHRLRRANKQRTETIVSGRNGWKCDPRNAPIWRLNSSGIGVNGMTSTNEIGSASN